MDMTYTIMARTYRWSTKWNSRIRLVTVEIDPSSVMYRLYITDESRMAKLTSLVKTTIFIHATEMTIQSSHNIF